MTPDHSSELSRDLALTFQALLYVSGELPGAATTAFETRLGEDQAARDALCQAVQLAHAAPGGLTPRPDPAYRQQVHQRLRPRRGLWPWLTGKRLYRGHPLVWSALGAAAAVLLLVGIDHRAVPSGHAAANVSAANREAKPPSPFRKPSAPSRAKKPSASRPPASTVAAADGAEARAWAELQQSMPWRKRILVTGSKH
jgi:hypothetical protein